MFFHPALKAAQISAQSITEGLPEEEIFVSYQSGQMPLKDATGRNIGSFTDYPVENQITMENGMSMMISPESNTTKLAIYPNPTNGIFSIEADNLQAGECEVSLYSMTGELVAKKVLSTAFGNLNERIDMSHLSNETYIVKLVSEDRTYQSKIIII